MFENYVGAKNTKSGAWTAELVLAAIVLHVFAGAALIIKGWWTIHEIDRPTRASAGLSSAPPPPPPPPGGSHKKIERREPKVKKVKEVTQIDERKEKPKVEDVSDDSDEPDGVEGGVEGGVVGGVVGGVIGGVEGGVLGGSMLGDAPPPPPPDEPKIVPQVALEASRISGEQQIRPPNDVAIQINRESKRVTATVKMCLSKGGSVSNLNMLKSSGYPAYDAKIKSKMRGWKYSPFKVNGKPAPVCTSVTFIYIPQN